VKASLEEAALQNPDNKTVKELLEAVSKRPELKESGAAEEVLFPPAAESAPP
jgi:hypothetical protein